MTKIGLFISSVLLIIAFGCKQKSKETTGIASNGLKLTASTVRESFGPSESMDLTLKIENVSSQVISLPDDRWDFDAEKGFLGCEGPQTPQGINIIPMPKLYLPIRVNGQIVSQIAAGQSIQYSYPKDFGGFKATFEATKEMELPIQCILSIDPNMKPEWYAGWTGRLESNKIIFKYHP